MFRSFDRLREDYLLRKLQELMGRDLALHVRLHKMSEECQALSARFQGLQQTISVLQFDRAPLEYIGPLTGVCRQIEKECVARHQELSALEKKHVAIQQRIKEVVEELKRLEVNLDFIWYFQNSCAYSVI